MQIEQDFDGETYEVDVRMEEKDRLEHIAHYPIKNGPRTFKSVNIFEVLASSTGKKVVCFWKSRLDGDYLRVENETKFRCDPEEVERLIALLDNIEEVADLDRGDYVILEQDEPSTEAALAAIESIQSSSTDGAEDLALELIKSISEFEPDVEDFEELAEEIPDEAASVEHLISRARDQKTISDFRELVAEEESEHTYQEFLEDHPWLFGNRYVDLKEERKLTRDEEVDFCLEAVSGYYDIFEIKRPDHRVMIPDPSHDTCKPSADLSAAVAQVQHYLKELDVHHSDILRRDGLHMLKPRGTVVIGSRLTEEEKNSLRIYNSHLNRIRVMTYDELIRRGERLVEMSGAEKEAGEAGSELVATGED